MSWTRMTAAWQASRTSSRLSSALLQVSRTKSQVSPLAPARPDRVCQLISKPLNTPETRAYTVLLPTLILLLDPNATPLTPTHALVVANLLGLASAAPSSFRDATATLEAGAKGVLETSIRQSVESRSKASASAETKKAAPQIALRSFG